MIHFVGGTLPFYDFGNTDDPQPVAPRLPDGSLLTGALSDSALRFSVTANPGGRQFRSCDNVLNPADDEEKALFSRLRACVAALNPDRKVYCTRCGVSIASSEPLCARCGARQFSLESLSAELENPESRIQLRVENLSASQDAVTATRFFQEAAKQILSKPLTLVPDRPSPLRHIFLKNRIWATREVMSDKEFEALAQEYLDRTEAQKRSAVARHEESVGHPTDIGATPTFDSAANASYQTAPLTDYRDSFHRHAAALFNEVRRLVGGRATEFDGSYSILARSGAARAAKIVIYQQGLPAAIEKGAFPSLKDGVYVWVRTSDKLGKAIWDSGIVQTLGFSHRFEHGQTIGIEPNREVRFAYFRLRDDDALEPIAGLLARCAAVRPNAKTNR